MEPPKLIGYNYSPDEAREARDSGRLLAMRTETSLLCNLRCRYCNGVSGMVPSDEISSSTIKDVISQVRDLGAKSVVVIGGGEPTIYPDFKGIISYINNLQMIPVVITNTTTMTKYLAQFLFDNNASVITKMDSLDEKTQNWLAGSKNAYSKISKGIENLMSIYKSKDKRNLRLGASFVTTKLNADEIPDIWRFCRNNDIYPNQEALVPRGRALDDMGNLSISAKKLHEIKLKLLQIDKNEYGYGWLVHMPLTGQGCFQHLYSIYLTSKGYVRPCADVDIKRFNVKDMKIAEILDTSFFKLVRNIEKKLSGKCGGCENLERCIGCRGIAYSQGINEGLSEEEALKREDPTCYK